MSHIDLPNDEISRRRFISRAASSLLGVGLMPAASLFSGSAHAAGQGASKLRQIPTAKRVIYLYMNGGMSHLDTLDPKPGVDEGPTRAIKTSADGIRISEYLPRLSRQMHHGCIVRSLSSTQGAHQQGNYFMHTSYSLRGTIRHPAMGAWLQKFQGKENPMLPGSVVIGNDSRHPGAGFFESNFAPLMISNPQDGLQNSKIAKGITESRFDRRRKMSNHFDQGFDERYDYKNVRAYSSMYDDAVKLMRSSDLNAFDITKEPSKLRDSYGSDPFGQGCLLARRLVEHGVRFVEVSLGGWDTHNSNFVRVPENCETLDRALGALIPDLERRGMLQDTMVVLASEFGRTPKINQNEGRDHYPQAFSAMLMGGGIQGGITYGKTDAAGAKVLENQVAVPDFNATIAYALGLPLDHVLYSPTKRPFTTVDKGKPITQIFA